jgi:hypothetical protein
MRQIRKVKLENDTKLVILMDGTKDFLEDERKVVILKNEVPEEMFEILQSLNVELAKFAHQDSECICKGVSIDYQSGDSDNKGEAYFGIVLSGSRALPDSNCPLNINSPRKTNRKADVDSGIGFDVDCLHKIEELIEEATAIVFQNKRAKTML